MKKTTATILFIVLGILVLAGAAYASRDRVKSWFHMGTTDSSVVETPSENNTEVSPNPTTTAPKPAPTKPNVLGTGTLITAELNHKYAMFGADAVVTNIVEDSRCPTDVTCIQAGTVKVNVHASYQGKSQDVVFEINKPQKFSGYTVTLTNVAPARKAATPIDINDYKFTFLVMFPKQ